MKKFIGVLFACIVLNFCPILGQDISPVYHVDSVEAFSTLGVSYEAVSYDGSIWIRKSGSVLINNATTISGSSGIYYERQYNKLEVSGRWFGLKSDTTIDATNILRNIANTLPSGSIVTIPSGVRITSTVSFTNNISLIGEQPESLFKIDGTFSPGLRFSDVSNLSVENLKFYKTSNTTTTTASQFINCSNVTFQNNTAFNLSQGAVFTASNYLYVRYNKFIKTWLSGVRFTRNGNAPENACRNVFVQHNYCEQNVGNSNITGHGAIFLGTDSGNAVHSNIMINNNVTVNQNQMCIAVDGRGYNIQINNNTMIQGGNSVAGEVVALGGGSGQDGMKKVIVSNNYIEQPSSKTVAANIVLYGNITDATITGNRFKYGPQGIFFHFIAPSSLIGDITVSNNTFNDCNQGILFYKDPGVTLSEVPYNIIMTGNNYWNCSQVLQSGTLSASETTYIHQDYFVNGKKVTRSVNEASIIALPTNTYSGYFDHTVDTVSTIVGDVYSVKATNTTAQTNILIGSTASRFFPMEKFAGLEIQHLGSAYNSSFLGMNVSFGTKRKNAGVWKIFNNSSFTTYLEMVGNYNDGLIKLGDSFIWKDTSNNRFRFKNNSLPSNLTDGSYLATNLDTGLGGTTPTFSGTVTPLVFTFTHGLGYTPVDIQITPANVGAAASDWYVSANNTNISITVIRTTDGLSTYQWYWHAK